MDIIVGYSNHQDDLEDNKQQPVIASSPKRDDSYIEFVGMTRVRRGTTFIDEDFDIDKSERIINDIVGMDAAYDPHQLPDMSVGTKSLFSSTSNKVNVREKYGSFHTIDWQRDLAKDRFRHRWLVKEKQKGLFEKVQALNDAWSGWFCVLLVGIGAGICAGMVDIGSGFTSSLRSGYCSKAFWLNKEQCCWDSNSTDYDQYKVVTCVEWQYWSKSFKISSSAGKYLLSWFFHVLFSLLFAGSAAILVKVFAPYASGSGVPEIKTILSGFVIRGYLGKWTLLIKSLGMILGTSAGLTLGKEGPFVHVASCCGNIFSYLFPKYGRNEAKKREILSAGAAAGVAVAFGAPIGGVLFSLEEVSYYFPLKTMWRSFFCAMIAAFIVRTVNPLGKGHEVLFFIEYRAEWSLFELIPFIFLGILGGLFGFYFIKANIYWCRLRKSTRLGKFPITEVLVIAFITSFFGYLNEYTRMPMSELINRLVGECSIIDSYLLCDYEKNNAKNMSTAAGPGVYEAIWKLILALMFYLVMIVITFGIKIPCGLFVPSLAMGAITGRIVGILMQLIHFKTSLFASSCTTSEECIMPGVYALVGACAFLGGATRMTVSLVVIMVELTSGLSLIVPLMVSSFTAKIFGELLCKGGIYDAHINLNGYPFLDNKDEYEYSALAVDVMKPQKNDPPLVILTQEGMTMKEIEEIYTKNDINGFPIVISKESQYLLGYIFKRDLSMAFAKYKKSGIITDHTLVKFSRPLSNRVDGAIRLHKLVDLAPTCVSDQTPMEVVIDLFRKIGVSIVLVTHFGKLLGTISKKDILNHLENEKLKHDKQNNDNISRHRTRIANI